ncbi:uncharacterized protein B0T15DRAFT_258284 [Chaetomium strumarium]|uniref:Uncharacterized protein n=1 Tax=Chaetomium strumarium TaxID=1170767 RepID=A0AAJ0GMX4_9PEZI|nr:hypothetical protein B0T15DRAFT_258284 [Chaetomium strumarium]
MATFTGRSGTLLGPLTATWTMPKSCSVHVVNCATCSEGFRGQQCVTRDGSVQASDHTTCWPPAATRVPAPQPPFIGWGFYSPGMACPAGYTTACTAQYGGRSEWDVEFTLVPGETAIGCCPEGFQCTNRNGNTCIAVASTGTPISVATGMCSGSSGLASVSQAVFADVITVTTTTTATDATGTAVVQTITREMVLLAPMFQLNHQSSDLVPATTRPSSTTLSTAPSGFPSSSAPIPPGSGTDSETASSTSVPASSGNAQSGLSTAATIGVGVGAALGGILLTAVVGYMWFKRRREVARPPPEVPGWESNGKPHPVYVYGPQHWVTPEMDAAPAHKGGPTELPS